MTRLKTYPWLVGVICLSWWLMSLLTAKENIMSSGQPIGADYIAYWSASQMADQGLLADSYTLDKIAPIQQLAAPVTSAWHWLYPPTFAALLAPITTSDYRLSLALFSICSLLLFALSIRCIAPPSRFLPALLLAPAIFINLGNGQNAALTAGIAALGLSIMHSQPLMAGLMLGMLTFKPQLALPLLVLLMLHREYLVIVGAIVMTTLLGILSILLYGAATWSAWLEALQLANQLNSEGQLPWHKMSSLFSFLMAIGYSALFAQISQAVFSMVALLWTWHRFRHAAKSRLRLAAWCAACLTLSPHLFNYDMLWLVLCMAWLATAVDALSAKAQQRLMPVVTLIWFYPLIAPLLQLQLGFNIQWFMPVLMLWILHRAELDLQIPDHTRTAPLRP